MKNIFKKISIIFGCLGLISVFSIPCVLALDRKENIEVKADYTPTYYGATDIDLGASFLNSDLAYTLVPRPLGGNSFTFISDLKYCNYLNIVFPGSVSVSSLALNFNLGLFIVNNIPCVDYYTLESGVYKFGLLPRSLASDTPHFQLRVSSVIVFDNSNWGTHYPISSIVSLLATSNNVYNYSNDLITELVDEIDFLNFRLSLNVSAIQGYLQEIANLEAQIETLETEIDTLETEIDRLESVIAGYEDTSDILAEFNRITGSSFTTLIDALDYANWLYEQYQDDIFYYQNRYNEILEQVEELEYENDYLLREVSDLTNQVDTLTATTNVFNLIKSAFSGIVPLLDIPLAPNITIGMVLTIPFVVAIIGFAIKLIG